MIDCKHCGLESQLQMSSLNRIPWLEKYRPSKLEDVVGNQEAIERFMIFAETGNIPNFLLTGSPGVGKTTVSCEVFAHLE